MSGEKITTNNVIALWGNKYIEVTRWLGKLQRKNSNCYYLWWFCKWAKTNPTKLLALKDNPANREAEQLLDDFVNAETPQFTNPVKVNIVTAVKSFYKYSYRDLARACGAITLIQQREHRKPKKEDLLKLWNYSQNLRDKSLITFVNSTALAKGTMAELKLKYFEIDWANKDLPCINCPSEILKGHGIGRYKGVRQITFLTPEAKRDFLNYKEWIEKRMGRKLGLEDKIWRNIRSPYEPLSYERIGELIIEISKDACVHFSWHDGRRFVETSLEEVGIHPNWARKIRGRKVRGEEAPYSQPEIEKLRDKYREAVSLLQFTAKTETNEGDMRIKVAIDQLRATGRFSNAVLKLLETETLGKEPSIAIPNLTLEAEAVERIAEREDIDIFQEDTMISKEAINREMEQIKRERSKTKNKARCKDGEHCQRLVTEQDLEVMLAQGWRVVTCLPSGKIVVGNEN